MNKVIPDELITEIQGLLFRKYPDYVFKEIFQDEDVNFPGEVRIKIFFWDMRNQRELWVCLIIPIRELFTPPVLLIELLIVRIDSELKKLEEETNG